MDKTQREIMLQGYVGSGFNPYIPSSVNSDLFEFGRMFRVTGRSMPREVKKSRGNSYIADGQKYKACYSRNNTTDFINA